MFPAIDKSCARRPETPLRAIPKALCRQNDLIEGAGLGTEGESWEWTWKWTGEREVADVYGRRLYDRGGSFWFLWARLGSGKSVDCQGKWNSYSRWTKPPTLLLYEADPKDDSRGRISEWKSLRAKVCLAIEECTDCWNWAEVTLLEGALEVVLDGENSQAEEGDFKRQQGKSTWRDAL